MGWNPSFSLGLSCHLCSEIHKGKLKPHNQRVCLDLHRFFWAFSRFIQCKSPFFCSQCNFSTLIRLLFSLLLLSSDHPHLFWWTDALCVFLRSSRPHKVQRKCREDIYEDYSEYSSVHSLNSWTQSWSSSFVSLHRLSLIAKVLEELY